MSWITRAKITPRPSHRANHPCYPCFYLSSARGKRGLIQWTWASIHAACAHLVDDADLEIVLDVNLAGQAHIWRQFGFDCKAIAFELAHLTGFAFENLDATSG